MPLADYGVLIGTLISFVREDPTDFGSWYHGKMTIQTPQGQYECAVDVSTPSGVPCSTEKCATSTPPSSPLSRASDSAGIA